ncbi:FadR/GntR family transcriptional regulator [Micromonospora globispora]|uniref:FadR/GntR family transcriptional regulator n=1 Tax=Micromonospora globispora TaxID=1450148 RepID=UPI0014042125|nr:FadR/GntR family transcriptional regulator [Micromonospora globispora]
MFGNGDSWRPEDATVLPGPTLAEQVADQILSKILGERLAPGAPLPSAREMGEEFRVSRTVIREAISSLAARGIVETRSGVGVRVGQVNSDRVTDALCLFMRLNGGFDYKHVHEVRHLLELEVVGLACERGTDEDLERIRDAHARMVEGLSSPDAIRLDVAFHRQIAVATHNPLYCVVLDSLQGVLLEARRGAAHSPSRGQHAAELHERILDAILQRDRDAAVLAMTRHLDDVAAHWASMQHNSIAKPIGAGSAGDA